MRDWPVIDKVSFVVCVVVTLYVIAQVVRWAL